MHSDVYNRRLPQGVTFRTRWQQVNAMQTLRGKFSRCGDSCNWISSSIEDFYLQRVHFLPSTVLPASNKLAEGCSQLAATLFIPRSGVILLEHSTFPINLLLHNFEAFFILLSRGKHVVDVTYLWRSNIASAKVNSFRSFCFWFHGPLSY